MVTATTKCRVLRFGVFELDLESRELRKRGIRVKLAGQSFHALLLLLERSPAVVTREELCRALWPDELWGDHDHRLNKTINRIREVLGDSADTPRFLETLPRVGYRFLVPVERSWDGEPIPASNPAVTSVQPAEFDAVATAAPDARRRLGALPVVAVCLAFALGAVLAYR